MEEQVDQFKLLRRVKDYREEIGVPYKFLACELKIPPSSFYNFTMGLRRLSETYAEALDEYLEDRGY